MTPNPQPQAQDSGQTTDTGQVQEPSGDTTQESQQPAAEEPSGPYKTFDTKEAYERQFGPTRTEGRLSLAKSLGFETIEAFNAAVPQWKQAYESSLTEQQKLEQERDQYKQQVQGYKAQENAQKLVQAAMTTAEALGIDPAKMERVMELRTAADGEISEEGEVNETLLQNSLMVFIERNPEFKKAPASVGDTVSGAPATAATVEVSLQEQINKANKDGDWKTSMQLESRKLFQNMFNS